MLGFDKFNYIQTIAEFKSFSKAAEKLYVAQPSLSRYVNRLEKELGTRLFDRTQVPIELTDAGRLYLSYMDHISKTYDQMMEEFSRLGQMKTGRFSLGIVRWRGQFILPGLITPFMEQYPGISIDLKEENTSKSLEDMVSSGRLDLCIINSPLRNKNLDSRVMYRDKIILAVPKKHPLNAGCDIKINSFLSPGKVNVEDLKNETFIMQKADRKLTMLVNSLFDKYGIRPAKTVELTDFNSILNFASTGAGIAFFPMSGGSCIGKKENLIFYELGIPDFSLDVILAFKKGRVFSEPELTFMKFSEDFMIPINEYL